MAQKVKFKRKTTSEINNLAIEDGSLIYNVENGKTYMDYGNNRIPTGGGANGGIYVGDTEPTDPDITLWVDTPISETKASEIVDEYTESDKVGYSTNYVNGINDYSTDETFTGKHWIDNKKIYRKVINFGALPSSSTTKSVAHNISNIDYVTDLRGTAIDSNSTQKYIPLPFASKDGSSNIYLIANDTNIQINVGYDRSGYSAYVVIEYTKSS